MFWYLLLAHFLGDYPLQSNWMVANRNRLWVRLLHGSIHFGLLVLLTYTVVSVVWPFYLVLVVVHLAIDAGKTWLSQRLPVWNVGLYIFDQLVHFTAIGLVAAWIGDKAAESALPFNKLMVLYAIGFLLVTYIWLISERILLADRPYVEELRARAWPRAFIRAGLLAVILLGWNALFPLAAGLAIRLPYPATRGGMRALLVDVLVTLVVAGFVIAANW